MFLVLPKNSTLKNTGLILCSDSLLNEIFQRLFLASLQTICIDYHNKLSVLEGEKFDLERNTLLRDLEVNTRRGAPFKRIV